MTEQNPYLSEEHFRKTRQRLMTKQRRILEDIALLAEALSAVVSAGQDAAESLCAGIHSVLLQYEIGLADAGRHKYGDKRRKRPRRPMFEMAKEADLSGPQAHRYARRRLVEMLGRLGQVVGNLEIWTHPGLPENSRPSDRLDAEFRVLLLPVHESFQEALIDIGWVAADEKESA